MEARVWRSLILVAAFFSLGAGYRTTNFIVTAPNAQLAEEIGRAAEKYRRDLSVAWLGHELPRWSEPCPIKAQVGNLGAGGVTQFNFGRNGRVFGWQMAVQGSRKRVLDSVLPHEITHTIFATHFKQPLPRWADEGACTTVEHPEERARQQQMLVHFLQNGKGISFTKMFAMMQYPRDMLPLYAQGYSLARFFIEQHGRRKFVQYIGDGLAEGNWEAATAQHYGYADMLRLQEAWLDWVRRGSPQINSPEIDSSTLVASAAGSKTPAAESLIVRGQDSGSESTTAPAGPLVAVDEDQPAGFAARASHDAPLRRRESEDRWRAIGSGLAAADQSRTDQIKPPVATAGNQAARPPGAEQARQVILEWNHRSPHPPAGTGPAAPPKRRSVYDKLRSAGGLLRR